MRFLPVTVFADDISFLVNLIHCEPITHMGLSPVFLITNSCTWAPDHVECQIGERYRPTITSLAVRFSSETRLNQSQMLAKRAAYLRAEHGQVHVGLVTAHHLNAVFLNLM